MADAHPEEGTRTGTAVVAERSAAPPAELVELLDRAAQLAQGSRSRATWQAYRRDWAGFIDWCALRGLVSMPAPATVCGWLADLAPTWPRPGARPPATIP